MAKPPFYEVWRRIVAYAGESFKTKRQLVFTYEVEGEFFYPSRTDYQISKTNFETAFKMVPLEGPGPLSNLVRGSSYVWAVLHDERISQGQW